MYLSIDQIVESERGNKQYSNLGQASLLRIMQMQFNVLLCLPSKKGEHIGLLLSVARSVGLSAVSVHYLCTGCTY